MSDDQEPSLRRRLPGTLLGAALTLAAWVTLDVTSLVAKFVVAFCAFAAAHGLVALVRGSRGASVGGASGKAPVSKPISAKPSVSIVGAAFLPVVVAAFAIWVGWRALEQRRENASRELPPPEEAAVPPLVETRPADGSAYLVVANLGVARIQDRALTTVYARTLELRGLLIGPDRAAYVLAGSDLVRIDTAGATTVATGLPSSAESLACASDGTLYVAETEALTRVGAGTGLRETTSIPLVAEKRPCTRIGLDAHDVLYCSVDDDSKPLGSRRPYSLHRWTGQAWQPVALPAWTSHNLSGVSGLQLAPDGRFVVAVPGEWMVIGADGAVTPLQTPDAGDLVLFSMRATRGGDALIWGQPTSYVFGRDGSFRPIDLKARVASRPGPVVDGLGRVWFVPKAGGFGVLTPPDQVRSWPDCSTHGSVLDMAVIGNGPELPEVLPAPVRGLVRGRLVRKKKPLVGAQVTIASARALVGESVGEECDLQGATATTDRDGAFAFPNVPRSLAVISVVGPDLEPYSELVAHGLHCCEQMKDGTGIDLGSVELP